MKKLYSTGLILFFATPLFASIPVGMNNFHMNLGEVPKTFQASGETTTLEWGCPVTEVVQAKNTYDALNKIGQACMDDVRRAAVGKADVFDVINVSVVWPDLQIQPTKDGYKMEGTLFLETLVVKKVASADLAVSE